MRNSTRFIVALVAAMIAMTAGIYIGMGGRESRRPEISLPKEAVTQFFTVQLNDVNGKPQALAQWRGKVLVINFWATWCPPCREEMPEFSRLQAKHAADGVQFVGIALDTAENVISFSKQHPVGYPLLIAESEGTELSRRLGNSQLALPYTVVLGPQEEVQITRLGRIPESELDGLLKRLVIR